jgi:hypothetical protein
MEGKTVKPKSNQVRPSKINIEPQRPPVQPVEQLLPTLTFKDFTQTPLTGLNPASQFCLQVPL